MWNTSVRVRVGRGSLRCSAVPEAVEEDEGRMWMLLFILKQKGNVKCRLQNNPGASSFPLQKVFYFSFNFLKSVWLLRSDSRGVAERGFELGKKLDEELVGIAGFEAGLGGWNSRCVTEQVMLDGLQ